VAEDAWFCSCKVSGRHGVQCVTQSRGIESLRHLFMREKEDDWKDED
jgi:hypothetical protein